MNEAIPGSNKELRVLDDQRGYSKEDKECFIKEFQPYMSAYSRVPVLNNRECRP